MTYKLKVEPLTAVHIGSGEILTPLDYQIAPLNKIKDDETNEFLKVNDKDKFLKFSSDRILSRLIKDSNKNEMKLKMFEQYSNKADMKNLQNFFQSNFEYLSDFDYPCDFTKSFLDLYQANRQKNPLKNAAQVFQMYRPQGKKAPVIPGSSIKGAIRTAVINALPKDFIQDRRNIEKEVLNYKDAKEDPFRAVLISDTTFTTKNALVGILKNVKKSRFNHNGLEAIDKLQISAEVIKGSLLGGNAISEARLIINEKLQNELESKKIKKEQIIKACNKFYIEQFYDKYDKFYNGVQGPTDKIEELYDILETIGKTNPNEFVIRVGRWSQVDFVTIKDFAKPKVPKGKKCGTSRTVFIDDDENYIPMGWCKCTLEECSEN